MNSSTSNSDAGDPWRRFFLLLIGTAAALALVVYGFIIVVDPFDTLAFAPRFDRVPVASNERFAFPALARDARFDSAIFGTSTSRLLRPAVLDPLFNARFANLAVIDAQAYEQYRLLQVFARHHRAARAVMIGIDAKWCETGNSIAKYTPRPFPEWLYEETAPLHGYLEMFSLYALTQAIQEFRVLVGTKKQLYGPDGYRNFLPDDRLYDPARALSHLSAPEPSSVAAPAASEPATLNFPAHTMLAQALCTLPEATQKILFFVPYYTGSQQEAGSRSAAVRQECKRRISRLASGIANTVVVDFMIPSPITEEATNYWDPIHYRVGIAERVAHDLATAARGHPSPAGDYRLLMSSGEAESQGIHGRCRGCDGAVCAGGAEP